MECIIEEDGQENCTQPCSECIYKNSHDTNQKKLIETLKQLEGIKKNLISLIK